MKKYLALLMALTLLLAGCAAKSSDVAATKSEMGS